MKPLISIIVPIYKVEKYLEKCIDSILDQTYQNLEIILVDDGSPDDCPVICDRYANLDFRVTVIHKNNGGLSDARNVGIEAATGDYIAFVDSDDYVDPHMYEILFQCIVDRKAEIAVCNFYWTDENGALRRDTMPQNGVIMSGLEALRTFFVSCTIPLEVTWNKLYSRRLFFTDTPIRFPFGKIHEDDFTTYRLFYEAQYVAFIDEPLYYYVQRSHSIMSQMKACEHVKTRILLTKEITRFVKERAIPVTNEVQFAEFKEYFHCLDVIYEQKVSELRIRDAIFEIINVNWETALHNPMFKTKDRLKIILVKLKLYTLYKKAKLIFKK